MIRVKVNEASLNQYHICLNDIYDTMRNSLFGNLIVMSLSILTTFSEMKAKRTISRTLVKLYIFDVYISSIRQIIRNNPG